MGLRFRRSWSVIPGVRFNMGLRSGSLSFGGRGLHYTVGTSGSRITAGIPGTGLFWTQKLNSPWAASRPVKPPQSYSPPAGGVQPPAINPPPSVAPQFGHARQPFQSALSQIGSLPPASGIQSPSGPQLHVFVPAWMAWAALAVIVIGVLCLGAATLGKVIG